MLECNAWITYSVNWSCIIHLHLCWNAYCLYTLQNNTFLYLMIKNKRWPSFRWCILANKGPLVWCYVVNIKITLLVNRTNNCHLNLIATLFKAHKLSPSCIQCRVFTNFYRTCTCRLLYCWSRQLILPYIFFNKSDELFCRTTGQGLTVDGDFCQNRLLTCSLVSS